MRLKSLEIQGFKSFPDKTRLEFVNGITAVVGPNGSGKSNIADAVRWVLGEQSTKTLRGGKMEDVIFGGTQTRKPVGYASVQLSIDNSDLVLADMDNEITVSRRLYRSGESEYRLNGTMVRLKDIYELFMDTGLGRDGYSIIGQGKISEIVSAKSRERREIFEEAAGIAKFRYRKAEAEKRLVQAEENLVRLRDILGELESRVGPLKEQAEKARDFLNLSAEKKELEISLWMLTLADIKERLAVQENRVDICKNEYEQLERESESAEEKINSVYERTRELDVLVESKRVAVKRLEERLSRFDSEYAVLQNDIRHNLESILRVESELEGAGAGKSELLEALMQKTEQLAHGNEAASVVKDEINSMETELAGIRTELGQARDASGILATRRDGAMRDIAAIRLEQAAEATALSESLNRLEDIRKNFGLHETRISELDDAILGCEGETAIADEKINTLLNTRNGYGLKRKSRAEKLAGIEARKKELEDEIGRKLQRARLLEDLENSMEGYTGSVKYILSESARGAVSGIHGVISSLISVDEEYTLAIETALGPAMQNIVTDTDETAKKAIRMLQNARAGRATFLPVATVKGQKMDKRELAGRDGFIGLASELVRCDSAFDGIVAQLLGRVAVAEDLESASEIAKRTGYHVRIVTLDGQVINAGGSFTGGSSVRSAGALGRKNEIAKLKKDAAALREEADAISPELKAAMAELSALDAEISGAASELQTAQEEKVRLEAQLENLKMNLIHARESRELAKKELEALTGRLERLKSGEADKAGILKEMDAELDGIEDEIKRSDIRVKLLEDGLGGLEADINTRKMSLLSAEKDNDGIEREIAGIQERIDSSGERSEALQSEKSALEEKNKDIYLKLEQLELERENVKGEIESSGGDITGLMAKRAELEAETTALRQAERDISSRREAVSKELARLEERRIAVQGEYDGIIAKLWDEYELTRSRAAEFSVEIQDKDKAGRRLAELKSRIKALGTVNVNAVEEYAEVSERYEFLLTQVRDVESSKERLLGLIEGLTQEMRDIFSENFAKIAVNFSKVFVQLFGGGRAELSLTEGEDVLESGVDIFVQPPGKVIKNLSLLSGGEQAFVAIAIYFAILKVNPAPFCLLDEIEAALDDVNVTRFAAYLRQMSTNTQFIAITHRRGTMEEADMLYGVTMQEEGVSKLLELKMSEVESSLNI